MKTALKVILLTLLFLTLLSCSDHDNDKYEGQGQDEMKMTATITSVEEKIEVEIIKAPYGASGTYWIITGADTDYFDSDGNKISRSDLRSGDTVEISYGGQVMMSYPPQIVATKIQIK